MYPDLPYPGYTWHIFQHMGAVSHDIVYNFLIAAATYSDSPDPADAINHYVISKRLLPPNIRQDTGQPEGWRDYRQIFSELSFIYSPDVLERITLTPVGLTYLDRAMQFAEVMTMQVLRYQYPNGHKVMISNALRRRLQGTPFQLAKQLAVLQEISGVNLQPAVLTWRILRQLQQRQEVAKLSILDMIAYVMRCTTNADAVAAVDAIAQARHGGVTLPELPHMKRNAQDWLKLLRKTALFVGAQGNRAYVEISSFGLQHADEIDNLCLGIEQDTNRWSVGTLNPDDKLTENQRFEWYSWYGGIDLSVEPIPFVEETISSDSDDEDKVRGEIDEDDTPVGLNSETQISLRNFNTQAFLAVDGEVRNQTDTTIHSSYSAGLANRQHRLHDLMVILIARTCQGKGASVADDPNTVDLLAQYEGIEFLIEVKSVTTRNFVKRIRYALGQVLHYDYLRSTQSLSPRRRVIAVTADVPDDSWCVPFLNRHNDIDLLSLRRDLLHTHSDFSVTRELFRAE